MLFATVLSSQYDVDVPLDAKFSEITDMINNKYNLNNKITYVYGGRTLKLDSTPISENLDNNSKIFIVESPSPVQVTAKQAPPPTPAESETGSDIDTDSGSESESEPAVESELAYTATYTGQQVKQVIDKNSNVMFNIIHMIGQQNPFFLSYIAVNPKKAQEYMLETLDQPDFKFVVKGESVEDDPIKPYLLHPCGKNGYQIDEQNLDYILEQCQDLIVTEEIRKDAKEKYLLLDRDIRKTIETLNHPENPLTGQ